MSRFIPPSGDFAPRLEASPKDQLKLALTAWQERGYRNVFYGKYRYSDETILAAGGKAALTAWRRGQRLARQKLEREGW